MSVFEELAQGVECVQEALSGSGELRIGEAEGARVDTGALRAAACVPDTVSGLEIVGTDDRQALAECLPGITRISPRTNTVTDAFNAGGQTDALALGAGALWYGTSTSNFLGRVDPNTDTILGQLKLPGPTFGATAAYGFVWATDRQDNLLF